MATGKTVLQLNRELADALNEEAVKDPTSPYRGKFVGLANGKVVVVADNLDSTVEQLRRAEPDLQKTFIIEAGIDYDTPIAVWSHA